MNAANGCPEAPDRNQTAPLKHENTDVCKRKRRSRQLTEPFSANPCVSLQDEPRYVQCRCTISSSVPTCHQRAFPMLCKASDPDCQRQVPPTSAMCL